MSFTPNGTHNDTTPGTATYTPEDCTRLLDEAPPRPWEALSLAEQQECMLQDFTPAQWLTDEAYLVGAVLRHDDRKWYHWKAQAKERGVDTYGYEKGVDKLLKDLGLARSGSALKPEARRRALRITARELQAKTFPPLTYVVEEILPAGCTLFTGKSKDGKSLAAYDLTLAVASGGLAFGRYHVTQGSVWYLALEDGERRAQERLNLIQDRYETELPDEALDKIALTLWEAPRLGEGLEEDLIDWIEQTPDARLIVIDILEKVRPPRTLHGNGYAQDYEPTAKLTQLAQEHNVAILVIHHANKLNPADFRDSASGCMSLIGGADNFWSLSRLPMSEDARLKITGRDIRHECDLAMQFKDGFWTALGDAKLVTMSQERQAVVTVLQDSPRPLTPKHIASALEKNVSTTKILLRKLKDTGVVMQPTEGHYALSPTYLSTVTPDSGSSSPSSSLSLPINPINPINSVNPVNPVNPETQPVENVEVKADIESDDPGDQFVASPGTVYGGFTRVYGGFTADNLTQPIENTELNGDTVYGFTGFTPATDCHGGNAPPAVPPACVFCHGTVFWTGATGHLICSRCHPQPHPGGAS